MSTQVEQMNPAQVEVYQTALAQATLQRPDLKALPEPMPGAIIKGDIRLRVARRIAARKPVKGRYRIDIENMQEPLQVIWITEGKVVGHTVRDIAIEFDLRGASAGETRTYLVTAHVSECDGRGSIIHSSVFVQVHVAK